MHAHGGIKWEMHLLPCLRRLGVNYFVVELGVYVWRINTITSTSHMYQPSTTWVCGGLILSLQHALSVNCEVELEVYGCVDG